MNQSEYNFQQLPVTSHLLKARANSRVQGANGFASHSLKKLERDFETSALHACDKRNYYES